MTTILTDTETGQLRQLLREEACRRLIEHYGRAVDWMDWATLKQFFWPDAKLDYGIWAGDLDGFMPWVQALEEGYLRRLHMFGIPRLAIGDSTGTGEFPAAFHLRTAEEGGARDDIMFARYLVDFECRDGEWRLSALQFLLHGVQGFPASDTGGAPLFADNIDTRHPLFRP